MARISVRMLMASGSTYFFLSLRLRVFLTMLTRSRTVPNLRNLETMMEPSWKLKHLGLDMKAWW